MDVFGRAEAQRNQSLISRRSFSAAGTTVGAALLISHGARLHAGVLSLSGVEAPPRQS